MKGKRLPGAKRPIPRSEPTREHLAKIVELNADELAMDIIGRVSESSRAIGYWRGFIVGSAVTGATVLAAMAVLRALGMA